MGVRKMRYSFWLSFLLLVVLGALCSAAAPARADRAFDDSRARGHFVAGESHFAAERWDDAEREFALAYQLSHRPEMLINLARTHERAGKLAAALADLEQLVTVYPDAPYCDEARQRMVIMREKLAASTAGSAQSSELPAVEAEPEPASPPPVAAAESPVQESTSWAPRWPTLVVGGAAVVAGVVALGTGMRAHGIYLDLEGQCEADDSCPAPFESDRDHGQRLSRASTALTFAAVALAGTAAVLWIYDVKKRDERGSLAFGLDGAGARLRARF
jgi:hypothetical protein